MKKLLLALMASLLIAGTAAVVTPTSANAAPGSPRCMTKYEWNRIHDGQTRARVSQIVGNWGAVTDRTYYGDGTRTVDVSYRQCKANGRPASSWNTVWISFSTEMLYGKYVWDSCYDINWDTGNCIGRTVWDEWAERGVTRYPRVDYKGSWSSVW